MNRNRSFNGKRPDVLPADPPAPMFAINPLVAGMVFLVLAAWASPAGAESKPATLRCPDSKELCIQADRSGGIDLKKGIAYLEGNVTGLLRSRALHFRGQSLTALRDSDDRWVRLVLDEDVRLRQADRETHSDHAVVEQDAIRLSGDVRIKEADLRIEGDEAVIETNPNRMIVRGSPAHPMKVLLPGRLLGADPGAAATSAAPTLKRAAPATAQTGATVLQAQQAVLEDQPNRVMLSGGVRIEESDDRFSIAADTVTLVFSADFTLESFRAVGNVLIAQPERRISGDLAESRQRLNTILLVGNARMEQIGQFEVRSERMEVYTDVSKGVIQSEDRQKPITLTLDVAGGTSHRLDKRRMIDLSEKGLPPATLEKLAPLLHRTFQTRTAFADAVRSRLTQRESRRYLETILAVAR